MLRFTFVVVVAFAPVVLTAQADEGPHLKPGLWDLTMSSSDPEAPRIGMQICMDAATDAAFHDFAMGIAKSHCSRNVVKSDSSQIITDSVCTIAGTQIASHSITNFTADTAYHTDVKTHFEPPMGGKSDGTATQDGKWTGPCTAGMQPGEMIGADGEKMNLKELTGR